MILSDLLRVLNQFPLNTEVMIEDANIPLIVRDFQTGTANNGKTHEMIVVLIPNKD